jgi:hypothetical protein
MVLDFRMDRPMIYSGHPVVIEPNMVFPLHMLLLDSDSGQAMCFGPSPSPKTAVRPCLAGRWT